MKQRNWLLIVLCVVSATAFVLSRTVWGPPTSAMATEHRPAVSNEEAIPEEVSDAQRRFINNQPRHWRYVMLKRN